VSDDLHARFDTWLAEGAPGEPPRDAAIHASVCPECLHHSAALDALAAIDLGLAVLPPSRVSGPAIAPRRSVAWARGSIAAAVVVMAVVTGAIAAPLLGGARDGRGEQRVLDATGTPEADATSPSTVGSPSDRVPSATASATPTASNTDPPASSASASTGGVPPPPVTSRPSASITPRASAVATPRPFTPAPTAAATPTPPAPTPTPAPPAPTPTPTPEPTPTPTPVETPPTP
jgi:hypothetical protein